MDLVIDSNVLFAALLKESGTSDILFKHKLYAPEFIFEEFRKYKDYLEGKTKRNEENFNDLFDLFERNVMLMPKKEIEPFIEKAEKISPDPKDVPYLALALKLRCNLWSNDRDLKEKQNTIRVYSTEELVKMD
ncbi:PIN domain-containing protein [Candidatus Woesearchaeota archaeon]|nr:PIN domain-containing protein [Candidatus Woesearchaeota archaeon]